MVIDTMRNTLIPCKHCNILFERHKEYCPVCHASNKASNKESVTHKIIDEQEALHIRTSKRRIFLIVSLCMTLIPCAVVLLLDTIQNQAFTWSPLVVLPLCVAYMYLLLLVSLYKVPFILGMNLIIVTLLFLNILNSLLGTYWFFMLGLPLTLGISIITAIVFFIISKCITKGLNIVAIVLIGISIVVVYIELIASYFFDRQLTLSWSLVVTASCVPVALIVLYFHKHRKIIERWVHF